MSRHPMKITSTHLADGRELIYFDDDPGVLSGQVTRELVDHRDLPEPVTESEMRRDPLTGEWITYAAHRNNRTFMPPANENPLAPTTPGNLPTEIPADDYDVVVFENRFPSFSTRIAMPDDPADYPWTVDGEELFPRRPAAARCEVICFTPDATASGVQRAADQLGGATGVALFIGIGFSPVLTGGADTLAPYVLSAALAVVGLAAGAVVVRRAIVPERTGAGTPAAQQS